jgi:hypothetical protein
MVETKPLFVRTRYLISSNYESEEDALLAQKKEPQEMQKTSAVEALITHLKLETNTK